MKQLRYVFFCALTFALFCACGFGASAQTAIPATPPVGGQLRVHFLDVGQADCVFAELPDGKTLLIDAGDLGAGPKIRAYLKAQGCERLDYVVATHPHADHIGGMADVVEHMEVGAFYMPKVSHTSQTFERMVDAVAAKKLKINVAAAGKEIPASGYTMQFVAPVQTQYDNLNNYSAVLRLAWNEHTLLFTGDAEALSEGQITAELRADILKVGHHGSDTSTSAEFLRRVAPRYAVISVGEGNSYGHPSPDTLRALTDAGAQILRTDRDGAVVVTCNADGISVTTEKSGQSVAPAPIASTPAPAPAASKPDADGGQMVWVTKTGTKYHTVSNCGGTRTAWEVSRGQAVADGLEPCKRCYG